MQNFCGHHRFVTPAMHIRSLLNLQLAENNSVHVRMTLKKLMKLFELRTHAEVDNEEGSTIRLYTYVKVCHTKCIGLCITCIAQKLCNGF